MIRRTCQATIDLRSPMGSEKVRGFQPPWRTVYRYQCPGCGAHHRVYANSFRGMGKYQRPEPSVGAIRCGRDLPEPLTFDNQKRMLDAIDAGYEARRERPSAGAKEE